MASLEMAHGTDSATVAKYNGLPLPENRIVEEPKPSNPIPNGLCGFVSTLGNSVEMNPILSASLMSDVVQKPKFMAKLTLRDSHSEDSF